MIKLSEIENAALNEKFPGLLSPLVSPLELLALIAVVGAAHKFVTEECGCAEIEKALEGIEI